MTSNPDNQRRLSLLFCCWNTGNSSYLASSYLPRPSTDLPLQCLNERITQENCHGRCQIPRIPRMIKSPRTTSTTNKKKKRRKNEFLWTAGLLCCCFLAYTHKRWIKPGPFALNDCVNMLAMSIYLDQFIDRKGKGLGRFAWSSSFFLSSCFTPRRRIEDRTIPPFVFLLLRW